MANLILRDRDSILTREGLLFRVFGYSHPPKTYICDAEYASAKIFTSKDPRAPRMGGKQHFYKFYNDEGMKLVFKRFPQYTVFHEMLRQKVVGVNPEAAEVRKPEKRLIELMEMERKDKLVDATQRVLNTMLQQSGLSMANFGVFGSMLHGFHNPDFSDIDLVVYGRKENSKIRRTLETLYADANPDFRNEFGTDDIMQGKQWRFKNFTVKEFLWHQRRKQIYGLFNDARSGRITKVEFEPVKAWSEIASEYDPEARIVQKGWVKIKARLVDDVDAPFIPSIYLIEPMKVLRGPREVLEAVRVFSYMEEFRLQAQKDETIIVEGNLEELVSPKCGFHQITLAYCPRYYEQVLKVAGLNL
ncbi:MAG: nucleotidyltransferase domain-containing protein [Candidatus Bathyarchaeota archaeon]|nr:nucleotidyltransferase domain-containing protein [Candidatus Bathyarchaeota archaeon]